MKLYFVSHLLRADSKVAVKVTLSTNMSVSVHVL
jgi:hypothetical protein